VGGLVERGRVGGEGGVVRGEERGGGGGGREHQKERGLDCTCMAK